MMASKWSVWKQVTLPSSPVNPSYFIVKLTPCPICRACLIASGLAEGLHHRAHICPSCVLADANCPLALWRPGSLLLVSRQAGAPPFLSLSSRPKNVSHLQNVGNKPHSSPHDSAAREPQNTLQSCWSHCTHLETVALRTISPQQRLRPSNGWHSCLRPSPPPSGPTVQCVDWSRASH